MIAKTLRKIIGDVHYALNVREHALVNYLLPEEKRERLMSYSPAYSNFVETGTYLGETTAAMSKVYKNVYTVELHDAMYNAAITRFAGTPSVRCFHGNSTDRLPEILTLLDGPALFWLDAHYSGPATCRSPEYETPIEHELSIIFRHDIKNHLILIDDARYFVGRNSYPRLGNLRKFVLENSDYGLTVRDDIIRLWHDPEWT